MFEHHYNKAPAVFDTLFPSHNLKRLNAPEEAITAADPIENAAAAVTPAPTEVPAATEVPAETSTEEVPAATEAPAA